MEVIDIISTLTAVELSVYTVYNERQTKWYSYAYDDDGLLVNWNKFVFSYFFFTIWMYYNKLDVIKALLSIFYDDNIDDIWYKTQKTNDDCYYKKTKNQHKNIYLK